MDLLGGYGSDSSSSDAPPPKQPQPAATTKPAAQPAAAVKPKKKSRRLLSLQAVLPPEILNRLSRPQGEDSDSDDEEKRDAKRAKVGGDRSGINSLLDELRCAPLQKGVVSKKSNDSTTKATTKQNEGLGLAFMSYTKESKAKISDEVVDVHAAKPKSAAANKPTIDSVPPKAAPKKPAFARISTAAPVPRSMQQYSQSVEPTTTTTYPIQYENSIPQTQTATQNQASHATRESYTNNTQLNMNSRKQRREQERSLRSGAAFQNNTSNTMELHQPSPTEFAPTAHMAAIASRAAHLRNLGNVDDNDTSNYGEYAQQQRKAVGVAMYDPKSGTDVKGGVTGKHKSKHQINQLMVSAMGLEANRAGEAELARLGLGSGGGKGNGGRAEAKNKYGW